jgi:hypothetical protein
LFWKEQIRHHFGHFLLEFVRHATPVSLVVMHCCYALMLLLPDIGRPPQMIPKDNGDERAPCFHGCY